MQKGAVHHKKILNFVGPYGKGPTLINEQLTLEKSHGLYEHFTLHFLYQAIPILMRVHGFSTSSDNAAKVLVPVGFAKAAIVGVFYGSCKPQLKAFLSDLMDELKRLNPFKREDLGANRDFSVRTRCVIADAKERAFLAGVGVSFTSTMFNVVFLVYHMATFWFNSCGLSLRLT